MAQFHEPLELRYWFMNVMSGSTEIFFFLFIVFLSSMAATFRMSSTTFLVSLVLFATLMSNFIGGIFLVVVTITGLIVFAGISKVVKG